MTHGYQDFLDTRDALGEVLDAVAGCCVDLDMRRRAQAMSDTHVRLDADTFRLMIVGEFKRGKSTLINAMLGDNVLPAKVAPCTGLITEVKWGDEPSAVLHPDEGEPRTIAVDEVRDYVVIDPDREGERLP